MHSPFSIKLIYLIERRIFGQKYKFSNKNDMVSAWRNFKNIFSRPLFTVIFRPEMLKFHPYSILIGDTMVEFVIFCVLTRKKWNWKFINLLQVCFIALVSWHSIKLSKRSRHFYWKYVKPFFSSEKAWSMLYRKVTCQEQKFYYDFRVFSWAYL